MDHYEIFLIPLLMLADYLLTSIGASLYRKSFGNYLVLENYELNPIWQESVDKNEKFNLRHLFMSIMFTAVFAGIDYYNIVNENLLQAALGYYIVLYSLINARHLDNIFTFKYADTHPGLLEGKVFISYEMSLKMSQYRIIFLVIPLGIIAFHTKSYFAWGGALSVVGVWLTHSSWLHWHRQKGRNS